MSGVGKIAMIRSRLLYFRLKTEGGRGRCGVALLVSTFLQMSKPCSIFSMGTEAVRRQCGSNMFKMYEFGL